MKLLSYWHESIEMLRWTELKPLLFDSIRTFGKSFVLITKYFWWLIALLVTHEFCVYLFLPQIKTFFVDLSRQVENFGFISYIVFLIVFCSLLLFYYICFSTPLLFIAYLTTRPTTEIKDFAYYLKYLNKFWRYLIIFIPTMIIFQLLEWKFNLSVYVLTLILKPCLLSLDIGMFFFFDSNRKIIDSMTRGFSLVFYCFPLCIALQIPLIIFDILMIFLNQLQVFVHYPLILNSILSLIIMLGILSPSAIFYAKAKDKYPEFFSKDN